jgi:hypothetical protein
MSAVEKISKLVKSQFPQFYHEEGENFIAFVQAYYAYLEQNGKLTTEIRNLQSYRDISTTTEEFIKYFINSFLPSVPLDVAADKKLMIKYINQFNQSRGTLTAYKLLFRAIFNEDVEINFPADQILKVSDGDWRKERYLVSPYDPKTYTFIGKTIVGTSSKAQALVEDIVRKVVRGRDIMQIIVSNIKGEFNHLEPIRLLNENGNGHFPIVEAGIAKVEILSRGGQYIPGDVVDFISSENGNFAKGVVTQTVDLLNSLTFSILDGGSGYTASIDDGGTSIELIGGDAVEEASFEIFKNDITDTFAIAININLISSNTLFGSLAPSIMNADGIPRKISQFANLVLSCPDYGFPEFGEETTDGIDFRDHKNAVLRIANTRNIPANVSLYGVTSSANARTIQIVSGVANDAVIIIDGYRNFQTSETVRIFTPSGPSVGVVTQFLGNTIGTHVLEIANNAGTTINEGDEVVGLVSNSFGVIKKILTVTANGFSGNVGGADDRDLVTAIVSANNSANLTNQFNTGPLKPFIQNEGLRVVGSSVVIGNTTNDTANVVHENIYTRLIDALTFEAITFGTISKLSLVVSGSGYSIAPRVKVKENDIAALGVGEAIITIQSNDVNWATGNSSFTKLDTNDRLFQSSTGASGDVKAGPVTGIPIETIQYANGTYEMTVRVWQPPLQRAPGNITFANNQNVTLQLYNSDYVFGEADTRSSVGSGTGKIVKIIDRGVLGDNAKIISNIGANGAITAIRVLDSGFCYKDKEIVIVEATNRNLATSATLKLTLNNVGNSEGYYATTRSHVSSSRGYIQDSRFYQEFSYEIAAPISLDRYRDIVLALAHPAGQALFGKYRTESVINVDVIPTSERRTRIKANGTVSLTNGSRNLVGSGTLFLSQFSNGAPIIVEYAHKNFYKIPINIVTNNTTANLSVTWANNNITGANAYYIV